MNGKKPPTPDSILLSLDTQTINRELQRVEAEAKALKILLRAAAARDAGKPRNGDRRPAEGGRQ